MNNDESIGNGCLAGLLNLFGFLFFWKYLERRDAQARDDAFRTQTAIWRAPRAASEWNAAVEEGFYDDEPQG